MEEHNYINPVANNVAEYLECFLRPLMVFVNSIEIIESKQCKIMSYHCVVHICMKYIVEY